MPAKYVYAVAGATPARLAMVRTVDFAVGPLRGLVGRGGDQAFHDLRLALGQTAAAGPVDSVDSAGRGPVHRLEQAHPPEH